MIGSLAGRILAEFATGKTAEVAKRIQQEMDAFLKMLDAKLEAVFQAIEADFDRLGKITIAAFALDRNREASIRPRWFPTAWQHEAARMW